MSEQRRGTVVWRTWWSQWKPVRTSIAYWRICGTEGMTEEEVEETAKALYEASCREEEGSS